MLTEAPPVGSRVYVPGERRGYRVRAGNSRYAICTKQHFGTVLYCIIDVSGKWRAPEDLIFGFGAETDEQCAAMLARLVAGESGLSRRHGVRLDIVKVKPPQPITWRNEYA